MNVSPEGEAQTQSISACVTVPRAQRILVLHRLWIRSDVGETQCWITDRDDQTQWAAASVHQLLRFYAPPLEHKPVIVGVKVSVIWRLVDSLSSRKQPSVQLCFIDGWVDADWVLQLFSVRNLSIVTFRRAFVWCDPAVMYKRVETLVHRSISCSTDLCQKAQRLSCHQVLRWRQFEQ